MSLSAEQLARRMGGIGASEIAAVACLSDFRSPTDVWVRKLGIVEDEGESDPAEVGHECEDAVARIYARRTGRKIIRWRSTTFAHPEHPFMLCTPDRAVHNGTPYRAWKGGARSVEEFRAKTERGLEVKVVGRWMFSRWGDAGDPRGVPDDVAAQCQWSMQVTGVLLWDVAAMLGTEIRFYTLEHDPIFADALFNAGRAFWFDHVIAKQAPEADGSDAYDRFLRKRFPKHDDQIVRADRATDAMVRELAELRARRNDIEDREEVLTQGIKASIGDALGVAGDDYKITWKKVASGSPRYRELAEHLGATPQQILQFTPEGSRRLTPSGDLFRPKKKEQAA